MRGRACGRSSRARCSLADGRVATPARVRRHDDRRRSATTHDGDHRLDHAPTTRGDDHDPSAWPAVADGAGQSRRDTDRRGARRRCVDNGDGTVRRPVRPAATRSTVTRHARSRGATVVLDPGHGGDEPGAVGPGGHREKDVNLAVAEEAQRQLEALGATVVLTRTGDYRITLASRAAIATALAARGCSCRSTTTPSPTAPRRPGRGDLLPDRVAGVEARRRAASTRSWCARSGAYDVGWVADTDAGAKYRRRADGGDYYGILRRTAGRARRAVRGCIHLQRRRGGAARRPRVPGRGGRGHHRGRRPLRHDRGPGQRVREPYPRTQPAGPGGGSEGCVDPPLG